MELRWFEVMRFISFLIDQLSLQFKCVRDKTHYLHLLSAHTYNLHLPFFLSPEQLYFELPSTLFFSTNFPSHIPTRIQLILTPFLSHTGSLLEFTSNLFFLHMQAVFEIYLPRLLSNTTTNLEFNVFSSFSHTPLIFEFESTFLSLHTLTQHKFDSHIFSLRPQIIFQLYAHKHIEFKLLTSTLSLSKYISFPLSPILFHPHMRPFLEQHASPIPPNNSKPLVMSPSFISPSKQHFKVHIPFPSHFNPSQFLFSPAQTKSMLLHYTSMNTHNNFHFTPLPSRIKTPTPISFFLCMLEKAHIAMYIVVALAHFGDSYIAVDSIVAAHLYIAVIAFALIMITQISHVITSMHNTLTQLHTPAHDNGISVDGVSEITIGAKKSTHSGLVECVAMSPRLFAPSLLVDALLLPPSGDMVLGAINLGPYACNDTKSTIDSQSSCTKSQPPSEDMGLGVFISLSACTELLPPSEDLELSAIDGLSIGTELLPPSEDMGLSVFNALSAFTELLPPSEDTELSVGEGLSSDTELLPPSEDVELSVIGGWVSADTELRPPSEFMGLSVKNARSLANTELLPLREDMGLSVLHSNTELQPSREDIGSSVTAHILSRNTEPVSPSGDRELSVTVQCGANNTRPIPSQ